MLAKLGFAVLIFKQPDILLLDEVFAVGDIRFQKKCVEAISKYTALGDKTLILVTHDPGQVTTNCSRAIWLDEHVIRTDGPAERVCRANTVGKCSRGLKASVAALYCIVLLNSLFYAPPCIS